jgi:large subunit ribosomal protein L13
VSGFFVVTPHLCVADGPSPPARTRAALPPGATARHPPARRFATRFSSTEDRQMRTYSPSAKDITRDWYVIDADGQTLGRLATRVATVLRGKHKPTFTPHMDMGDHVVVINADKIVVTGGKAEQKLYHSHSGFPGGIKSVPFAAMLTKQPVKIVENAIKGMLPKTKLGNSMSTKLKVYPGADHPHAAQQPKPFPDHV